MNFNFDSTKNLLVLLFRPHPKAEDTCFSFSLRKLSMMVFSMLLFKLLSSCCCCKAHFQPCLIARAGRKFYTIIV